MARIRFPLRRTADGARISDMPVAEAERILREASGAVVGGGAQQAAAVADVQPAVEQAVAVAAPRVVCTRCSMFSFSTLIQKHVASAS